MVLRTLIIALAGLWPCGGWAAPSPAFVGCPADGMSGPAPAPAAPPPAQRVPPRGDGLALYAAAGMNVLAPRGWHCFEMYGSGGAVLLVTPRRYTAATFPGQNTLSGPAVELLLLSGENSGRDQVAELFSRLFPAKRGFIRSIASDDDPPRHYPRGPFPSDRTVRRGPAEVDYATPPHRTGMGTYSSRLRPSAEPIAGAVLLAHVDGVDSAVLLNVRLPPGLRALGPAILRAAAPARVGQDPRALQ